MTPRNTTLREELSIVPKLIYVLIAVGFAAILGVFLYAIPHHATDGPRFAALLLCSVLAGAVLSMYLLLIGYVNQDAKRRDMSQVGWTLLVILFFNGLGPLVYFLLRKPLIQYCPQCGTRVENGFHYCAKCGCGLAPSCKYCGQAVDRDFVVCPYCGKALKEPAAS